MNLLILCMFLYSVFYLCVEVVLHCLHLAPHVGRGLLNVCTSLYMELVGRVVSWLDGRWDGRLVGGLVYWSVGWMDGWFVCWMDGWLVCLLDG